MCKKRCIVFTLAMLGLLIIAVDMDIDLKDKLDHACVAYTTTAYQFNDCMEGK